MIKTVNHFILNILKILYNNSFYSELFKTFTLIFVKVYKIILNINTLSAIHIIYIFLIKTKQYL